MLLKARERIWLKAAAEAVDGSNYTPTFVVYHES